MKSIVYKGELVFLRILIPVVLAIVTGFTFQSRTLLNIASASALISLAAILILWLKYNPLQLYLYKWLPGSILHVFLFSLSLSSTLYKIDSIHPAHYSKVPAQCLLLRVMSEPRSSNNIVRFESAVIEVFQGSGFKSVRGKLLVAVRTSKDIKLQYGDELLIPNKCTEIDPPYNPFEFDYKTYLLHQGIEKQVFLNAGQYKVIEKGKGNPLISYALKLRRHLVAGFSEYIQDQEAAALASTLILGYRVELSPEIITAYAKTGTMHVLSVSGMHVLLVFSVLTVLLSFLDQNVWLQVLKVILIITAIWFYAMLTGFSSAVCRAAVMCSIYVVGKTFNKRTNSYNTLSASALLLLLYNPYFLFDAGFQLSYLAVAGLIYLYPKIRHLFFFNNKIADAIWSWAAVSISAQLATLPLSLYYFHQFPVYFLISNLFIIIPMQLVMYIGIGFLALFSLKTFISDAILEASGELLDLCIQWTDKGLIYIEKLPFSSLNFYPYGSFYYLLLFAVLIILVTSWQFRNKRALFLSLFLLNLMAVYTSYGQIKRSNKAEVIIYSLRKNRAIAFFRSGKCFLSTDLKSNEKTYSFSLQPSINALASSVNIIDSLKFAEIPASQDHFLKFGSWRLMIWDRYWKKKQFNKKIRVDAVLLSDNPKIELRKLKQDVDFSLLLIDATNMDHLIEQWMAEARNLGIKYYVLKRNPAFRLVLKS